MSAGKVVVIVLVAIALLFVVSLAAGSHNHGSGAQPDPSGFLGHLQAGKFLQVKGDVTVSGCTSVTPQLVTLSTACVLRVPGGGAFSQATRFALVPTGGASVAKITPANGPEINPSGACIGGAFDRHGGTILLTGSGAVRLQTTKC